MESEGLRIPSAKKVPQLLVNQIWYQVDLFSFFSHQVDWPKAFIFSLSLDEFQELGELTQHFKSLHYASSTIAAASWFMFLGLYLYYPLEVTLKSTELCLFLQQRLVSSRKVGAKGYEQNSEVCSLSVRDWSTKICYALFFLSARKIKNLPFDDALLL